MIDFISFAQHVSAVLESPIKPVLMFLVFVPWAWLVSSRIEKDAKYFHLEATRWSAINIAAGLAALAAMLFVPFFWIGWPVGILILLTPVLIYWRHRNQSVPEAQRFYLTGETLTLSLQTRREARAAKEAAIQFIGADGKTRKVPLKDDPEYPVHMLAEDLIGPALDGRASSLQLEVSQNACAASQTVDGIRYKREPIDPQAGVRVIDYLKEIAGLDVQDRRRRQAAEFSMRTPVGTTDLSVTCAGSSTGMVMRIVFDRAKQLSKPFDGLGLLPSQLEALKTFEEPHERHGIILIGAPPGQGLSTTMYSAIGRHDAYTSNIKTLEREVLLEIDGVDHVLWDPSNPDIDYATNMQSILRRDPDVVMTGHIKERETAEVILAPGMQGPLIYVPQRAATIAEQVREWVKLVGDLKMATKSLRVVMNQRLLRSLCPNCRQGYQPPTEQLKKLNLPASKVSQLYRAGGKVQVKSKIENCPVCGGTGYLGQTGVFEVLTVDSEVRRLLAAGDLKGAMAHARRNKMIYMQEAALSKVVAGETTLEEVKRIIAPARAKAGAAAGEAA